MRIRHISIRNFRGIRELDWTIPDKTLFCLIGRGDSTNPNVTIPRDPCADSTGHHRTERPENVDPPRHDL